MWKAPIKIEEQGNSDVQVKFTDIFAFNVNDLNTKTNHVLSRRLIGLSKERPILGDHAKAHIHEIRQISCEIWWISCESRDIAFPLHCIKLKSFVELFDL